MLELLSPAGSMDALRAAVQNGANAVYLGIGTFNARQGAKNFTLETLGEALKYCHIRGVAVHLTLNTLVTDREFKSVAELIRKTAEAGVDAYIVQDLGVAQLCRQIAPEVPVHGSTQLTVHSLPGVLLCAAIWIVGQAMVNIGVVVGVFPVLGVPMPFVSAGGSSMIMCLTAAGLVVGLMRSQPQIKQSRQSA